MRAHLALAAILFFAVDLTAQAPVANPVLFRGARTDVLIDLPELRAAPAARRILSGVVESCRVAINISPGDSSAIVSYELPAPPIAARDSAMTVTISLLAVDLLQPSCGGNEALGTLAASRGLRVSSDTTTPGDQSIVSAVVTRGGKAVVPLATQQLRIRRISPRGLENTTQSWLRLTFELDAFTFAGAGADSGMVVAIETGRGGAPDLVRVPESAIRALWRTLLPQRAEALAGRSVPAPVELAKPKDVTLAHAHEAYVAGDLPEAARRAALRGQDLQLLSREDRVVAHLLTGISFFSLGDSSASNVAFTDLIEAEPCFQFDAGVAPAIRDRVATVPRARARCWAASPIRTAVRSLALPGFGRPMDSQRWVLRSAVAAAVIGTAVAGYATNEDAKTTYQAYVDWQYLPGTTPEMNPAEQLFREAEAKRQTAKSHYMTSAAIYALQSAWAIIAERMLQRKLEVVTDVGRPAPRASVAPVLQRGAVGAAITLTW